MANEVLPKCIRFIDGSDAILFQAPTDEKEVYWSRKKHCMQFQIVCDQTKRIRHIYTGYPGSVHDAKVFTSSPVYNNKEYFTEGEYMIGDSAYVMSETVVVPFKRNQGHLSKSQSRFNKHISRYRVIVEHTIGLLKGRFQSLRGIRIIVDKQCGHRKVCE